VLPAGDGDGDLVQMPDIVSVGVLAVQAADVSCRSFFL
jgi:hypothetical protein